MAFNKYVIIGLYVFVAFIKGYSSQDLYSGTPCELLDGSPGICKLAKSCEWLKKQIISRRISPPDLSKLRCGFDGNDEIFCCGDPLPNSLRKSEIACNLYRNQRIPSITNHILPENISQLGDFPHMAALGYLSEENNQIDFRCGASLISERYVLTAAHCAAGEQPIVARLGTINVINPEIDPETYGNVVDVNIESVILHPDYKSFEYYNDIALVHLSKEVYFNENLHPACLNTDLSDILPSTELIVTGWGKIDSHRDWRSPLLLETKLNGVGLSECNVSLSQFLGRKLSSGLNMGHFCAHDPKAKSDECERDSGGPLQIFDNVTDDRLMPILLGVTSFGVACDTKLPSVYARVAFYLDWIESHVWPN